MKDPGLLHFVREDVEKCTFFFVDDSLVAVLTRFSEAIQCAFLGLPKESRTMYNILPIDVLAVFDRYDSINGYFFVGCNIKNNAMITDPIAV